MEDGTDLKGELHSSAGVTSPHELSAMQAVSDTQTKMLANFSSSLDINLKSHKTALNAIGANMSSFNDIPSGGKPTDRSQLIKGSQRTLSNIGSQIEKNSLRLLPKT